MNKKIYRNEIINILCFKGLDNYVPTFFIISFYFSYNKFTSQKTYIFSERLLRIIIPYIIWPCLFWFKYTFINSMNGIQDNNKYKILFYQILIGKPFHPVFWFQFCLLFWSFLFIIIIILFKNLYYYIIIILLIIIFNLNYFGYINNFFINYNFIIIISVKELFITSIYMISGFLLGSKNLIKKN